LMDSYVAEMKAAILSICPDTQIVDITHLVEKFDVRTGAFLLAGATMSFPQGTVHLAVIDPGVGSKRRPIVIESRRSLFVGPDNGLLVPAASSEGILHAYEITNHSLFHAEVSSTFHGRDIFAPVAAHLAHGTLARECGPEIEDYHSLSHIEPTLGKKTVRCEVLHVDGFGNVVTNLSRTYLSKFDLKFGERVSISVGRLRVPVRFVKTYSDLNRSEVGILVGGHGFLELACRESSAAKRLRARIGAVVRVYGVQARRSG
jgi:S-adenosylmethionine hydrolase